MKIKTVNITRFIIAIVTLGLIGFDIFVAIEPTKGDTISEVIGSLGSSLPIIPFIWGVLGGHFFLRRSWYTYPKILKRWRFHFLGVIGIVIGASSFFDMFPVPLLWLILGIAVGNVFWPQFSENFKKY